MKLWGGGVDMFSMLHTKTSLYPSKTNGPDCFLHVKAKKNEVVFFGGHVLPLKAI